ncbi:amidase signature domain-containing protein [Pseudoneurospora amorphoporcata]|uniref:Amidase signature domain-containing protein n=1 Tax=Pseudoneurospora amorphoporcata TaxID=241081 RepID=A0AAN6NJI7_9PEZI|nr:amidase signature domain-containing protein [Pseudoneurospora amorphoporcata]
MAKLICRLPWSKGVGDSEHSDVGKGDEFTAGSEYGRTSKVGAALYVVAPFQCRLPASSIDKITRKFTRYGLATVFSVPSAGKDARTTVRLSWIQKALKDYETVDDVFDQAFLATVVFNGGGKWKPRITPEAKQYLTKLGARDIVLYSGVADLPPGPYYMTGHQMRDVWKLEDDIYGTCMVTVAPKSNLFEPFQPLSWIDSSHYAYYDTYDACTKNAPCIQKLVDKGAIIVSKTKMNSFANWEEPIEYVDYQAPWNPRGDQYQSMGGSSSGSAAAVAAYDWLDITIGTDTWGSVTRPALWCGCFGLRPTLGAVSGEGIKPFCKSRCIEFATQWLDVGKMETEPKPFTSIIWATDFWNIMDARQVKTAREFAGKMGSILGVDFVDVSFEATWAASPPPEARGLSLPEFIKHQPLKCYDAYHSCEDFRARYRKKFGRTPYVSPRIQGMWEFAKEITREERDLGFRKMDVYRKWFKNTILTGKHSNTLVMMPLESMGPRYRDEVPTFRRPPQDGINALGLASVMKSPVLAVPIDEISYNSRVSSREEKLPFMIAIMARQGYDLALMDETRKVLEKTGKPTVLRTGRRMYTEWACLWKSEIR